MPIKSVIRALQQNLQKIKLAYLILAAGCIVYFAANSKDVIITVLAQADYYWLVLCVIIWVILHAISPLFTAISFRTLSQEMNYKQAYLIHASNLPAKYLPGGIWHSVARSRAYYNHGLTIKNIGAYILQENLIIAAICLGVGGAIVMAFANNKVIYAICLLSTLSSFMVLIIWPWVQKTFVLKLHATIHLYLYILSLIVIFLYWLIAGFSFSLYVNSFLGIGDGCSQLYVAGVYIYSWGIGFITLFAPQGLGVSEYIASELICSSMDGRDLIAILTGFRIIILIADFSSWLISMIIRSNTLQSRA